MSESSSTTMGVADVEAYPMFMPVLGFIRSRKKSHVFLISDESVFNIILTADVSAKEPEPCFISDGRGINDNDCADTLKILKHNTMMIKIEEHMTNILGIQIKKF
jgi:hypothetical protein